MSYQFLPPLSDAEYEALREDIAQNGMRHPILVDEKGKILDGHHRARIAAELGFKPERETLHGLTEVEKRDVAFKMNVARRHLDTAAKRAVVVASLKADPRLSDRQHARRTGSTHPTVAGIRAELEARGQVESFTTRTDAKGVEQPASRPSQPAAKPVEADAQLDTPTDHGVSEADGVPAPEAGDGAGELRGTPAPQTAIEGPGVSPSVDADGEGTTTDPDGADAAGDPTDRPSAGSPVNPLDDPEEVERQHRLRSSKSVAEGLVHLYSALDPDPIRWLTKWVPDAYGNRGIPFVEDILTPEGIRTVAKHLDTLADYLDKTDGAL